MTTAARVRRLIERSGDTIRAAAHRVGCPKSTLADLLNGSEAHLDRRVQQIARAYEVDPDSLVPGKNPKADFEWTIRCTTPRERFEWSLLTVQDRTRMTLEYLENGYPERFGHVGLASASGLRTNDYIQVRTQWDYLPPDMVLTKAVVNGVMALTGMYSSWFAVGLLCDEVGAANLSGRVPKAFLPALESDQSRRASLAPRIIEAARKRLTERRPLAGECA